MIYIDFPSHFSQMDTENSFVEEDFSGIVIVQFDFFGEEPISVIHTELQAEVEDRPKRKKGRFVKISEKERNELLKGSQARAITQQSGLYLFFEVEIR